MPMLETAGVSRSSNNTGSPNRKNISTGGHSSLALSLSSICVKHGHPQLFMGLIDHRRLLIFPFPSLFFPIHLLKRRFWLIIIHETTALSAEIWQHGDSDKIRRLTGHKANVDRCPNSHTVYSDSLQHLS